MCIYGKTVLQVLNPEVCCVGMQAEVELKVAIVMYADVVEHYGDRHTKRTHTRV